MTRRIRAAVVRDFGQALHIEELELAPPGAGEVEVDIRAVAICGSDIHAGRGSWGGELPVVNGHEASGVVSAVGDGVDSVGPGEHVVVTLVRSCGVCPACRRGEKILCSTEFPLSSETRLRTPSGEPINQGIYVGGFAEAVVVHESQVVAISAAVPFDAAALLACGVVTGYGAVTNTAAVPAAASVCVVGVGGVGLNAIQGAVAAGAEPIIAIDVSAEKLAAAFRFGATHTISSTDATTDTVRQLTADFGADYVFAAVGNTTVFERALEYVRPGGTLVIVGITETGEHMRIETSGFASSGQRVIGSRMGSTDPHRDIPHLVARYVAGNLLLDELITGRFALEWINEAISSTVRGEALRNVVVIGK